MRISNYEEDFYWGKWYILIGEVCERERERERERESVCVYVYMC